jgi:hypothetical protein
VGAARTDPGNAFTPSVSAAARAARVAKSVAESRGAAQAGIKNVLKTKATDIDNEINLAR